MSNRSDDCFKVLTWNHKRKQFMPREKVASTGCQITRAVPKDPKKVISLLLWKFHLAVEISPRREKKTSRRFNNVIIIIKRRKKYMSYTKLH